MHARTAGDLLCCKAAMCLCMLKPCAAPAKTRICLLPVKHVVPDMTGTMCLTYVLDKLHNQSHTVDKTAALQLGPACSPQQLGNQPTRSHHIHCTALRGVVHPVLSVVHARAN